MAIIPRYTSRALPEGAQPGLVNGALARGRAGARLAAAAGDTVVAGVGYKRRKDALASAQAAARLAERIAAEKRRNEDLDHQNNVVEEAKAESQFTQKRAIRQATPVGADGPAKGWAERALADYDRAVWEYAQQFKDRPQTRARIEAIAESGRAPMSQRLMAAENRGIANDVRAGLANALDGLVAAAGTDPAMAPGAAGRGLSQIEAAMQAGMLSGQEAAATQQDFADRVHMAAMRGQIARDPAGTRARLQAGEFDEVFDGPARDRLIQEAGVAARADAADRAAKARARQRELHLAVGDYLVALGESGQGDAALEARARAELPPADYAAFEADQAAARERYATRREYTFITPRQMAEDIAAKAPGGGPRDTDARAAGDEIRRQVRDEVLAARAADPAGWAMQDESVAQAFAAAAEKPDDPALARKATQLRLALQREMGIERPRLLSTAERDWIAEQLAQAAPGGRRIALQGLLKRHGGRFERLLVELAGAIDADTIRLGRYAPEPRVSEALAKGMDKAYAVGPSEANGDASLIPVVVGTSGTNTRIDASGMKPFRQYVMPDGDRMAYDGEALVPVAAAQVASVAQTLPGGATLWPGGQTQAEPTDWFSIVEQIPKVSARAALAAVGTAAAVLLTPWNASEEYHYFGDGARLRTAPGDLFGTVQRLDPNTGEWAETDLVGFIVSTGLGSTPSIVARTPAQVERARRDSLSMPDGRLPPPPPLIPPVVPDTGKEEFPATESHPDVHETPPETSDGDTETFPIPETPRAQAEIFLALSDEIMRQLRKPLEAHRGDEYTQRGNDIVVQKLYEQLARWFPDIDVKTRFDHVAGATLHGEGEKKVKERIVHGEESHSFPDIEIMDTTNEKRITLTTGATLKDGKTLIAAEQRQLDRLKQNIANTGVAEGLPKLRPGMDEAEYTARVEKQLEEFFTKYFGRPPTG